MKLNTKRDVGLLAVLISCLPLSGLAQDAPPRVLLRT
jgi:hypothetical protein